MASEAGRIEKSTLDGTGKSILPQNEDHPITGDKCPQMGNNPNEATVQNSEGQMPRSTGFHKQKLQGRIHLLS